MEAAGEDVGSYNQIWDIALKDLEFREKIGQGRRTILIFKAGSVKSTKDVTLALT